LEAESAHFSGYSDEDLFSIYEDLLEIRPTQQPLEAPVSLSKLEDDIDTLPVFIGARARLG
jgi:hypothetical protein